MPPERARPAALVSRAARSPSRRVHTPFGAPYRGPASAPAHETLCCFFWGRLEGRLVLVLGPSVQPRDMVDEGGLPWRSCCTWGKGLVRNTAAPCNPGPLPGRGHRRQGRVVLQTQTPSLNLSLAQSLETGSTVHPSQAPMQSQPSVSVFKVPRATWMGKPTHAGDPGLRPKNTAFLSRHFFLLGKYFCISLCLSFSSLFP